MSIDKQYIKGFNHGYILAEHDPELAKKIVKQPNLGSEYFKGIVSGKQEYDIEKIRQKVTTKGKAKVKAVSKLKGRNK